MAANYGKSSHKRDFLYSPEKLAERHKLDKENFRFSDLELKKLRLFFCRAIQELGKKIKVASRGIATAIVYFGRFYVIKNFWEYDPRLISVCCLYVSSKAEEFSNLCPAGKIVTEASVHFRGTLKIDFPYSVDQLLVCEYHVLEVLQFYLIIFHPYRSIELYVKDLQALFQSDKAREDFLNTCLKYANDSYFTDIPLIFAPHEIGLSCVYLASLWAEIDLRKYLAESSADLKNIYVIASLLHKFYAETTQDVEREKIVSVALTKLTQRKTTFDEIGTAPSPAPSQPNTPQKPQEVKK